MTANTDTQAHGGGVEAPSVHDQAGALLVHLSGIPMVEWVWSDAEMIFAFLNRVLAASPAAPAERPAGHVEIAHDGFSGDIIGHYETRDGKRGVVVQQDGTRVVHVYGEKWLAAPAKGER